MSALERLWKDKMDVYRFVDMVVNGVTKSKEENIVSGVKCQYSKGNLTDTGTDGCQR